MLSWLSLISALIGFFSSVVPRVIQYFERKQEIAYELDITRLKVEAATRGYEVSKTVAGYNASVADTNSAREHDESIDGGDFVNMLRASVRPVITYTFFGLWLFVKLTVIFTLMRSSSIDLQVFVSSIMDEQTVSLFSLICGFWFGSRAIEKISPQKVPNVKLDKA